MAESYFVREKKDRDYTVICNHFIKNDKLSWKAKGVMTYLLSLPDDWQIHKTEIQKHATDGRDSLTSAINELRDAGYISVQQQKKEGNGHFASVIYIVREIPLTENPLTDKPLTENPKLLSTNKPSTNILNNNTLSEEKEETTPIKSEREIELEKSFDEALANLPSSPIENCDNTKRNVSVTKGSTKKRTKKNCVRAEQLEDDEFYKPVYEAYRSAFFSLYDKGTIPNCGKYKSFVDDCLKRYRELELSNIQIRDLIVTAINNAKSDKFIVQKRFPIAMILSESVMPRLVDTVKTTDDPKVGVDFNSQNYGV